MLDKILYLKILIPHLTNLRKPKEISQKIQLLIWV